MQADAVQHVCIVKILFPGLVIHYTHIQLLSVTPDVGAIHIALQLGSHMLSGNPHRRQRSPGGEFQFKPLRHKLRLRKLVIQFPYHLPHLGKGAPEKIALPIGVPEACKLRFRIFFHKPFREGKHTFRRNGGKTAFFLRLPHGMLQNIVDKGAVKRRVELCRFALFRFEAVL